VTVGRRCASSRTRRSSNRSWSVSDAQRHPRSLTLYRQTNHQFVSRSFPIFQIFIVKSTLSLVPSEALNLMFWGVGAKFCPEANWHKLNILPRDLLFEAEKRFPLLLAPPSFKIDAAETQPNTSVHRAFRSFRYGLG